MISQWRLRAAFAARLSEMYGREVPAYLTLVDVSRQVNEDVLRARGTDAERLGSIARVTAERHGAIRVGTPAELAQVARIFGALGMRPVGFYDLREAAAASAVPVVSTAFRPVDEDELALNPFRVFTSMLIPADRRFFDADLRTRLEAFLSRRTLFPRSCCSWPTAPRPSRDSPRTTPNASWTSRSAPSNSPPPPSTRPGTRPWNACRPSPPTSAASAPPTSTT